MSANIDHISAVVKGALVLAVCTPCLWAVVVILIRFVRTYNYLKRLNIEINAKLNEIEKVLQRAQERPRS